MPRHDTTVLRYEAWTLPWSGDFHRVVASIPVVEGSGRGSMHFREVAGEGSMDIDLSNFDRLDDIISDTTGTLIRVFDGTTIIHEWLAERVNRVNDDSHRIASVSGPSLQASFDKWVVYPWDYPKNPSLQPDWVYGGRNIISNPSFEDNADIPTIYTIYTDATTGTFSISDGTDATDPIAFDATAAQLETRLENDLGLITDVLVTGEGTEENRWEIEFQNPSFGVTLSLDSHTLNGDIWIAPVQVGGPSYSPAMKSQTVSVGSGSREYGAYDAFEVTTAQAHTGTHSLLIDPAPVPPRYAGVQWVVNVKPGTIHQASIWIRPTSGTNKYRFVVRAPGGGSDSVGAEGRFIDSDTGGLGGTSFPANTWSQITITDMEIPDDVSTIIVRLANVDATGNPAPFYVDDVSLTEGFAPSTLGLIATDLLNDASLDHLLEDRGVVLDWVDYSSFDETNDSSSVAWDQEISVNIPFGFTYGQVWDTFTDLGYEWELVPKASPSATLTHDLHWYNKGNRDDAPATAINVRQGVTGGSVLKRIPGFNAAIVEAGDGVFKEQTFASDFGRIETFLAAREAPDDDTLDKLLTELLDDQAKNRVAAQFSLVATHDHSRALVDYRPGDTVAMQMPPNLPKEERRVQQVSYVNNYPTEYVVVGSRVFMGEEAGGWELVRRLWRRFLRRDKDTAQAHPFLGGGGGGMMTVAIAASDALDTEKEKADFICTGDDDIDIIKQAADMMNYENGGFGGTIWLSSGTFTVKTPGSSNMFLGSGITIRGMGPYATFIAAGPGQGGISNGDMFQIGTACVVRDLNMYAPATGSSPGVTAIHFQDNWGRVENVMFQEMETAIRTQGMGFVFTGCGNFNVRVFVNNSSFGGNTLIANNGWRLGASGSGGTGGGLGKIIAGFRNNVIINNQMIGAIHVPFGGNAGGPIIAGNFWNDFSPGTNFAGPNNAIIDCSHEVSGMVIANNYVRRAPTNTTAYVHIGGGGTGITITGNEFAPSVRSGEPSPTVGIRVATATKGCNISDNLISSLNEGIKVGTASSEQLQIVGNTIYPGTIGIEVVGGTVDSPTLIERNRVWQSGQHGIRIAQGAAAANVVCRGNILEWIGTAASNTYDGITTEGTVRGEIRDNFIRPVISGLTRCGIRLAAGATNVVVLDNNLGPAGNYGTDDICDFGTDTLIRFLDGSGSGGVGGSSSSKVVFSQAGTLTTGTGTFKLPFTLDAEIISVQLAVATSPTGADLIVDVNKNGTTVFTTQANRPTVPDGDANGVGAEAVPDVTAISEGDYLTIDIDQIGSTVAGEDLTVVVEWRPT